MIYHGLMEGMPMNKRLWIIPALLFSFYSVHAKTVDRILAKVGDDIITLSELNRTMASLRKELEARFTGEQLQQEIQKAEKQALDYLIEDKLIYQKGIELGFDKETEPKVAAYIQRVIKDQKFKDTDDLEQALIKQGESLNEFRQSIERGIIKEEVVRSFIGSRITLLRSDLEKYYRDHIAEFTSPAEVTLSEIIITEEGGSQEAESRAGDLHRRLQQGESFAALASQYSKGTTANKGGSIGTYIVNKLNPDISKAITDLKEGEVSKPQKIKEGYVIFRVDSRKPVTVRPLDDVMDQIRNRMYEERYGPEYDRFVAQLKEDAYIEFFSEIK